MFKTERSRVALNSMVGMSQWSEEHSVPACELGQEGGTLNNLKLLRTILLLPCSAYIFEVMLLKIVKNKMVCISCYITNSKMKHQSQ